MSIIACLKITVLERYIVTIKQKTPIASKQGRKAHFRGTTLIPPRRIVAWGHSIAVTGCTRTHLVAKRKHWRSTHRLRSDLPRLPSGGPCSLGPTFLNEARRVLLSVFVIEGQYSTSNGDASMLVRLIWCKLTKCSSRS